MTEVKVEKLNNPTYVISIIKELLSKLGIEYGTISCRYKEEQTFDNKHVKMAYVDIDNYNNMPDETYDKFYTKVGMMVEDNDLVSNGYDITATLLN